MGPCVREVFRARYFHDHETRVLKRFLERFEPAFNGYLRHSTTPLPEKVME